MGGGWEETSLCSQGSGSASPSLSGSLGSSGRGMLLVNREPHVLPKWAAAGGGEQAGSHTGTTVQQIQQSTECVRMCECVGCCKSRRVSHASLTIGLGTAPLDWSRCYSLPAKRTV